MEPARLKQFAFVAGATVMLGIGGIYWSARSTGNAPAPPAARVRPMVPAGTRIKVEVVNTTARRGLARQATFALRDAGFDVVRFTTDTTRRDTTAILDRSGHPDWARLMAKALGTGRIESRPDSSRYLDITVLLGADWRAPAQPFYP
jgi:hypothetical protein